jgi:hypothetical protein
LEVLGSLENMLGLVGKFELQRDVFEYHNMLLFGLLASPDE